MRPPTGMGQALLRGLIVLALFAAISFPASHAVGLSNQPQAASQVQAASQPQAENPNQSAYRIKAESKEKATINKVISDPVFGSEKDVMEWRYTGAAVADTKEKPEDSSWIESVKDFIEFLSKALRILVWIGGVLLMAALVYFSYRYRHTWMGTLGIRSAPPSFLFGLDVRPQSLPDDVVAAALQELAKGNAIGTLSLLYRAALVSLIHRSQLDFHAGHTEDDCLRLVRNAVDAGCSGYFAELLAAWKLTAYAHEVPPSPVLEALCHRWRSHFAQVGNSI